MHKAVTAEEWAAHDAHIARINAKLPEYMVKARAFAKNWGFVFDDSCMRILAKQIIMIEDRGEKVMYAPKGDATC